MPSSLRLPREFQRPPLITACQPVKALYLVAGLCTILVRLPIWCIRFTIPSLRQNSSWTWRQALIVRLFNFHWNFTVALRLEATAKAEPGGMNGEGPLFELIPPPPEERLKGILLSEDVKPVVRPGAWWPMRYNHAEDSNVVLYCFGGAYVVGSHAPKMYEAIFSKLSPILNSVFFTFGYRLASTKGNHFPSQLQDALGAYQHLLDQGVASNRIILLGDSAGANLILALLRYISENSETPKPRAAILGSPWVNLAEDVASLEEHSSYATEMLRTPVLQWGVDAFVPGDLPRDHPYISPCFSPFKLPVPTWIHIDRSELLYDSVRDFYQGLKKVQGNDVDMFETEGGVHDELIYGLFMGFTKIVEDCLAALQRFIEGHNL